MPALVEIKGLAEVIRATSDCLKGIADNVAHAVRLAAAGYDEVAARRQGAALLEIRAQLLGLGRAQGVALSALDHYLLRTSGKTDPKAAEAEWRRIILGLEECLGKALAVFEEVKAYRGDFFLEKDYDLLMETLGARIGLFRRLAGEGPPATEAEREALREAAAEWRGLLMQLRATGDALRAFLRDGRDAGTGGGR